MSALTDLFTALANKIRSKTGTATTYTPLEMVSDGIDDVYAAGYDAGGGGATGIPITPSNLSPVSLTNGESYEMLDDGYAISSYTDITPSSLNPVELRSHSIYKTAIGSGYAVKYVDEVAASNDDPPHLPRSGTNTNGVYKVTNTSGGYLVASNPATLTPSDSSPPSIASGTIYRGGGTGYAIASSPTSVTPSSSAQTLSSGIIYKMNGTGYVYSSQPNKTETTLWTNSAPTSNFSSQDVTLSQGISNFDYIKVYFRQSTSVDTTTSIILDKTDIMTLSDTYPRLGAAMYIKTSSSANSECRAIRYVSNTSLNISGATKTGTTGGTSSAMIPTKITGIKYNGIS